MVVQKVKINGKWETVTGGISSGNSGITEEKEVYIGSEEPPVGTKVWIDPTGTPSTPSAGVEVIDNLESESTTAALSANQGRVLKEMIEELPSGGGAAEGTKLYPIYVPYFLETESLTTEQQQANADAVAAATNGDKIILELLLPDGLKAIAHSYSVMDGALILDLARSGVLNLSDYRAYVDMVILSTDGSVAYDSHDVFTLATKEYVDNAVANSGGGGGGVSEDGTLLLPIYAAELQGDVPLTSEEIEANKIAYRAAREGVKALYYIHSVQLGDIKFLMSGTVVNTDVVIFVSSLGVAISSDQNSDICDATMYTVMIASDGQSQGIDLSRNLATKEYVDEMANNTEAAAKQYTDEKIGNPDRLQLKFQRVQNEHTLAMTDSSSMWLEGSMEDAVLYLPEDDAFDGWMLNVFAYPVISKQDGEPFVRGRILCPHKTEVDSIYHASQIYLPNGGHLQLTYSIVKHEWVLLNDQSNGAEYTRYEA